MVHRFSAVLLLQYFNATVNLEIHALFLYFFRQKLNLIQSDEFSNVLYFSCLIAAARVSPGRLFSFQVLRNQTISKILQLILIPTNVKLDAF